MGAISPEKSRWYGSSLGGREWRRFTAPLDRDLPLRRRRGLPHLFAVPGARVQVRQGNEAGRLPKTGEQWLEMMQPTHRTCFANSVAVCVATTPSCSSSSSLCPRTEERKKVKNERAAPEEICASQKSSSGRLRRPVADAWMEVGQPSRHVSPRLPALSKRPRTLSLAR